ncbi:MAG: hypothetical protein M3273_01355 [Actinomycetota bacterium]|nr:hypothetical protein [Actinomycetota bacterium]
MLRTTTQPRGSTIRRVVRVLLALLVSGMALYPTGAGSSHAEPDGNPLAIGMNWAKGTPVSGEQSWVTFLCRFADDRSTPHPPSWYREVMTGGRQNAATFWREASLGRISVRGGAVKGWYDLPRERASYFTEGGQFLDEDALVEDCADAAGNDVFFPAYDGITLWVNGSLVAPATGVRRDSGRPGELTLDGRTKRYWFVVQSSDDARPLGQLALNMGEAFGWGFTEAEPDSGGGRGQATAWDLMSGISEGCWHVYEPSWCIPVHPAAFWKHVSGWIPDRRVVEVHHGETVTVTLHPHETPAPSRSAPQLVLVPLRNSQVHVLTVEARRQTGYDARPPGTKMGLPGEGVIVHRADLSEADVLLLDDSPGDGVVDDEEARRSVGETYRDPTSGVEISVDSRTPAGAYVVTISSPALPPVPNDDFDDAFELSAVDGADVVTHAATLEDGDPVSPCTERTQGHTTWFRFTPPVDGFATFGTSGSDHWTVVGLFAGEHGRLVNLGCDAQGLDEGSALRNVPLQAGVTYYFETASLMWWEGGNLRVGFSFAPGSWAPVQHTRYVQLELGGHLVARGRVLAANEWFGACTQRVEVEIRHLVSNAWKTIRTGSTNERGRFRIRVPDRVGNYEAHVTELSAYGHVCSGSGSGTLIHEH